MIHGAKTVEFPDTYKPRLLDTDGFRRAAVALVLRNSDNDTQVLFIRRSHSPADPWSGQIAFPGGNQDPGDHDVLAAAIRETREEVGLRLTAQNLLGQLDDQQARTNYGKIPLAISCFVFFLSADQPVVANHEVGEAFWVNLSHLSDPAFQFAYQTAFAAEPYPAIRLPNNTVLWGLTYRFVRRFLTLCNEAGH